MRMRSRPLRHLTLRGMAVCIAIGVAADGVSAQATVLTAEAADSGRIVAFVHWERGAGFVVGNRQSAAPPAVTRVPIMNAIVATQETKVELGRSRADGWAVLATSAAGRQRLVFSAEGYRTLQCRVEVRAGATDTVEVRLLPSQSVPGFNANAYGCRRVR